LLHELEARDAASELLSLLCVRDRCVQAALRDPDAACAERDPSVVERRHRHLEPAANLADDRLVADVNAVEEELGRVLRAQAELALDRPRFESVGIGRHGEAREPTRASLAGAREDERRRRPRAERDEDLLAREPPAGAVALRARLEASRVGPGAGLGQRVAAERVAGGERGEQPRALLVGAEARDRLAEEAVRDGDDPPHVRVGAAELLDDERVGSHVEPQAAVLLGERRSEEAERGELADDPAVDRLAAIPLGREGGDLSVAELARGPLDQLLLGGKREVHSDQKISRRGRALSSTQPTGRFGLAPLAVTRRGFDLLALRTRRELHCTTGAATSARGVGKENLAYSA